MSTQIHPTAIISPDARIGMNVTVGPFTIIESDVEIGDNTEIMSSVVIGNGSRIGKECTIFPNVTVSLAPQDLKYANEPTQVFIGDRTVLRECVTVHRGTTSSYKTIVGTDCLLMAYCHIAHDCVIGNHVILANATQLGGHVHIGDWAFIGGASGVHQFCHIGKHAMVGAHSMIVKDVAPFVLVDGNPATVEGINKVGLRRRGFTPECINNINDFYKILFRSGYNVSDGLARIEEKGNISGEIQHCIDFIRTSKRGIYTVKP